MIAETNLIIKRLITEQEVKRLMIEPQQIFILFKVNVTSNKWIW